MNNAKSEVDQLIEFHEYDFRKYKGNYHNMSLARNLVDYEAGKTILDTAMGIMQKKDTKQTELF